MSEDPTDKELQYALCGYALAVEHMNQPQMFHAYAEVRRLIAKRIREERIKAMEECCDAACSPRPAIERLIAAERAKGEA